MAYAGVRANSNYFLKQFASAVADWTAALDFELRLVPNNTCRAGLYKSRSGAFRELRHYGLELRDLRLALRICPRGHARAFECATAIRKLEDAGVFEPRQTVATAQIASIIASASASAESAKRKRENNSAAAAATTSAGSGSGGGGGSENGGAVKRMKASAAAVAASGGAESDEKDGSKFAAFRTVTDTTLHFVMGVVDSKQRDQILSEFEAVIRRTVSNRSAAAAGSGGSETPGADAAHDLVFGRSSVAGEFNHRTEAVCCMLQS